ncbi:hypothetical protein ACIPSA_43585 [Streptomyces sp. NPDC086549]|uniref:hypothetical protein n=1 Tax=Streptomyces sp. NPDC086549 TaxID=3365752 RepID=UPI00381950D9
MFRGTTARAVISLLTAALLALQLIKVAENFAPAHTFSHTEAKAQPGFKHSSKTARDGLDTFRAVGRSGEPAGPPLTRDRHRTAAPGWAHERPLAGRSTAAAHPTATNGTTHHRTARPSRALSPAALQVFRC